MSISYALTNAMEIKLLNELENWVDWNKKLQGILGLAGLWKILTEEFAKPTDHDTNKLVI